MKKIDLGQTIQLLANVGVIAGIAFLGLELQQNNELLEAQVRRDRLVSRSGPSTLELSSVDIAALDFKALTGQPFTEQERFNFQIYVIYNFMTWEWQYDEVLAGTIEEGRLPVSGWRVIAGRTPIWREMWEGYADNPERSPEFVSFVSENVFGQLDQ